MIELKGTGTNKTHLRSTTTLAPPTTGTISFWINMKGFANLQCILYVDTEFAMEIGTDGIIEIWLNRMGAKSTKAVTALSTNTWYHISATFNNSGDNALYINGVQDVSENKSAKAPATDTWYFGAESGTSNYLDAYLEDLRFYDRILTSGEIDLIYQANGLDGDIDGLLHSWSLNTGAEDTNDVYQFKDLGSGTLEFRAYPQFQPQEGPPTTAVRHQGSFLTTRRSA